MSHGQNDPLLQEITTCETLLCEIQNSSDAAIVMTQDLLSLLEEGKEVITQLRELQIQKTEQTEELITEEQNIPKKSEQVALSATSPIIPEENNEREELATSKTTDRGTRDAVIHSYLEIFNYGSKEQLLGLKGVGEMKATEIIECRKHRTEPFQNLEDLERFQVSTKLIKKILGLK